MRAKFVGPHVTLAFGLPSKWAPELLARGRDLATQTNSFTVTFAFAERSHDPFEHAHKLFLICDTGADVLTRLHKGLYAGGLQGELDPDHPFRPHMTVATQAARADIDRLDPGLLGPLPITARITALDIADVSDSTLQTVATIPLLP